MFGQLFKELKDDLLGKPATEVIEVAKPYCMPARGIVESIFSKYGVKLLGISEKLIYVNDIPGLVEAKITVSAKQAVWAEYLLLRSQKFMLWSKPLHPKNLEWATKHKVMPESWNGKPLIEKNCKEGLNAFKGLKKRGK